jgi:hypothetical protein
MILARWFLAILPKETFVDFFNNIFFFEGENFKKPKRCERVKRNEELKKGLTKGFKGLLKQKKKMTFFQKMKNSNQIAKKIQMHNSNIQRKVHNYK